MTETVQRSVHVPGMDGLRALACLAVFGVHWQQMTSVASQWGSLDLGRLLDNGNTGVALFMILSGFLLSLPIFAASPEDRRRLNLREFWRRRAVRILPAYYTCLIALVIITAHWRSVRHVLDVVLHATFLHNVTPWSLYSINPPFWALAPIVQFYALFALVVFGLRKLGRFSDVSILVTIVAFALVCQVAVTIMALAEPSPTSMSAWLGEDAVCLMHSLPSHACIFALGVLAARAHLTLPSTLPVLADVTIIASAVLCFFVLATPLDDRLQIPGGRYNFPYVPLLLGAVVLAVPRSHLSKWLLEISPIKRLGVSSYAFYILHLPIMKTIRGISQSLEISITERPYIFALASIATTIAASGIIYLFLERPLASRLRLPTIFTVGSDTQLASSKPSSMKRFL